MKLYLKYRGRMFGFKLAVNPGGKILQKFQYCRVQLEGSRADFELRF
jgi:hypothetical protein